MSWGTVSLGIVILIAAMIISARIGVFPRNMVFRDAADARRSTIFARFANLVMPAILLMVALAAGSEPAVVTGMLALYAAVDAAYYVWVAHRNS